MRHEGDTNLKSSPVPTRFRISEHAANAYLLTKYEGVYEKALCTSAPHHQHVTHLPAADVASEGQVHVLHDGVALPAARIVDGLWGQ